MLIGIGEIWAGNNRGGGAFAVADSLGVSEGMINGQGSPGEGQGIQDESIAVHLKIIAGAVDGDFPRVWGDALPFGLDAAGAGVQAVGGGIDASDDAEGSLDLGPMENAVAEEDVADGVGGDHSAVMGIGHIDAAEEFVFGIGFAIAVEVVHEPEARLLGNDHAGFGEGDAVEGIESFGEGGAAIGFAIVVGIFQDEEFIFGRKTWDCVREGRHGDDPQAASGVEGNLDGVTKFGELDFGSEEIDGETGGDLKLGLLFGWGFDDAGIFAVVLSFSGRHGSEPGSGETGERSLRGAGQFVNDRFGGGDHLVIAWDFSGVFLGAFAHAVIEVGIFGPDDFADKIGFLGDGPGQFGHALRIDAVQGGIAEEGAGDHAGHEPVALWVEMQPIHGQCGSVLGIGLLAGREEIDEESGAGGCGISNSLGVGGQIAVAREVVLFGETILDGGW